MQHELETAPPERRVVTLNEAAAILRISRGSAYEAAKRGEIPTIRIGRRLLVPTAALERMLGGNAPREGNDSVGNAGAAKKWSARNAGVVT
jgi:excisionase family DNA binding protein